MKVLIVDDEILTREGLISSINWKALDVTEICQAGDGIQALKIARTKRPDIILCDVRMPRMNGIQLIEQLELELPDTTVIFMSGYSDKEYLKAAIHLKAISYVEKPLDPLEIEDAILKAKEQHRRNLHSRKTQTVYSLETSSQLAFILTKPFGDNRARVEALTNELALEITSGCTFTSFIVRINNPDMDTNTLNEIRNNLERFLRQYLMQPFYISIHRFHQVYHLLGEHRPSNTALVDIASYLKDMYAPYGEFYISQGETFDGISRAYHSYSSAVVLMQSSFFFPTGTTLTPQSEDISLQQNTPAPDSEYVSRFQDILIQKCEADSVSFLDELFQIYYQNRQHLPNQAKDLYYKLFVILNENWRTAKLSSDSFANNAGETMLEYIESCFSFTTLHKTLVAETENFFRMLNSCIPEDSTIYRIKEFISSHYSQDTLSIKDISDHVFLSATYVCTYFKHQTGQTLNQYLTDYRMERAKILLADSRHQISDISSKVGYSNGNYFSKTFKKSTGLTPSGYREKILG